MMMQNNALDRMDVRSGMEIQVVSVYRYSVRMNTTLSKLCSFRIYQINTRGDCRALPDPGPGIDDLTFAVPLEHPFVTQGRHYLASIDFTDLR